MRHYKVKSPVSGAWFAGPLQGVTSDVNAAHVYSENDEWLRHFVEGAIAFKRKVILRPVNILEDILERDIEASPALKYVECPDCEGSGVDCASDPYPCPTCEGQCRLKILGPVCAHGIHGHCDQH